MEYTFYRQKLGASMKLSKELITDSKISIDEFENDIINHTLTSRIETFLYSKKHETRKLTVYHKRPTFWQWLFKKPIQTEIEINCMLALKNPPNGDEWLERHTVPLYEIKQVDDEDQ